MNIIYVVFDLEATCWKDRTHDRIREIIEIGAIKLNIEGEIVSEFNEFVRPQENPILSNFCMRLTTITQTQVGLARTFPEVFNDFRAWIGQEDYLLCSWGFYDKIQFEKDCKLHNLSTDWLKSHISLKHQYAEIRGIERPTLKAALEAEELSFRGTHRRAIDDARNITQIFNHLRGRWNEDVTSDYGSNSGR